ncbi:Piwi domain-containing protein [Argonema galeatum]|uniref:Piwi domain-containing protein n=1 Tax=Argonema galeatum TaxID=2942762 RepID=UPI00201108C0|nr:Piwi domain-containing protein [Argonema galeatum]MCL1466260.1 stem cell self-renewal protein Piwi [Argonema galeatum A003/A1]
MTNFQATQTPTFLSEIFPLDISQPNFMCFRLSPEIERKDGNRLSFHFSRELTSIVVIWNDPYFYALGMPNISLPSLQKWKDILADVQEKLKGFGDRYYSVQLVRQRHLTPFIKAQLAFQVLRTTKFEEPLILSDNKVEVRREIDYWPETIELPNSLQPALALTVHSSLLYRSNLEDFYENHPYRQNFKTLLKGLKVRDIEFDWSYGTISNFPGNVGEHREKLIKKANRESSKKALLNAPDDQTLVTVQFRNREQRDYPMAFLRPCVTSETADRFEVDYGKLLKGTKIGYKERTDLLASYKQTAEMALDAYGFQMERSINSRQYPELFWQPLKPLDETPLEFGKKFIGKRGDVLKGLSERNGGVYSRHNDYRDPSRPIRIAAVKLCDLSVNYFLDEVIKRLKSYGFNSEIVTRKAVVVNNLIGADARAEVERSVDELMEIPTDIVLTFLPQSDRNTDKDDGGSLYYWVYSRLLRRQLASQVIYAHTLSSVEPRQILNQVIPGILAKLGNLPFILAEPLKIAHYFIGLDVSRESKERLPGTVNACASVRLYDTQGKFIRYRIEDALIEGEEIPQRLLETLLPAGEMRDKTTLIYRDGSFCGQEVEHLRKWANAIKAKFILVECRKSCIPRLYNLNHKIVTAPEKGLAFRLSSREAVVVTTKVSEKVGLARPLRLTVHEDGHQASIEDVVETTLKLTLLHHGSLQTPRLPMPLYGSDRMAYLRLNGIYPSMLQGDRQFWL